jgi:hypothetical protein
MNVDRCVQEECLIELDSYPVLSSNVIGKVLNSESTGRQEAVLVLPHTGKIEVLNEVGARIWSLSDGSRTIAEISAAICAEYNVNPDDAQRDVLEFIEKLHLKGIIEINETPAEL